MRDPRECLFRLWFLIIIPFWCYRCCCCCYCHGYHSTSFPFTYDRRGTTTTNSHSTVPSFSSFRLLPKEKITKRSRNTRSKVSSFALKKNHLVEDNYSHHLATSNNDDDSRDDSSTTIKISSILGEKKMEQIQNLVNKRAKCRWEGQYDIADTIRYQIQNNVTLPIGYQIFIQDIPRKDGGGSIWKLVVQQQQQQQDMTNDGPTVLQLAHSALGLAVEQSIQYNNLRRTDGDDDSSFFSYYQQQLDSIVQQAKQRIIIIINNNNINNNNNNLPTSSASYYSQELAGRKAADAAFWFAIAGVTDTKLFSDLIDISTKELKRFGHRSSCRPKDVYQILERFAAAGIINTVDVDMDAAANAYNVNNNNNNKIGNDYGNNCKELEHVADRILNYKNQQQQHTTTKDDDDGREDTRLLDLHSNRSLLLLWKFSTKQKKQKAFLRSAHRHWEQVQQRHQTNKNGKSNANNALYYPSTSTTSPTTTTTTTTARARATTMSIQKSKSANKYNWNAIFKDPSRPLVIDIGCGFGVSLLGLAKVSSMMTMGTDNEQQQQQQQDSYDSSFSSDLLLNKNTKWSDCNFAGVDLGALGIGYANGVAKRIGLGDRLHFFVDSAEDFVEITQTTYPGPIILCLVQFPTPFRLQKVNKEMQQQRQPGNTQLPDSAEDGFMVSKNLLRSIQKVLSISSSSSSSTTKQQQQPFAGKLLIQSNCEDVAIWMRNMACNNCDFDYVTVPVGIIDEKQKTMMMTSRKIRQPQRTIDWIAMGGERASGPGWLQYPILPRSASTETEVACTLNGTPVHRCILKPKLS